jgi:hypothetical protein
LLNEASAKVLSIERRERPEMQLEPRSNQYSAWAVKDNVR